MGKFTKTIHFIIFIKLFFINYPYLGSEDEENCCITICPCFRDFKDKLEKEKEKLEEKETNLKQKEEELKEEEKILQNQKNIYEANKTQLNKDQQKYNDDIIQLNKDQQKYNDDIIQLNKEKEDFEKKAKELEKNLEEKYKQKEIELKHEEYFKKKEQELEKKLEEKYKQKEIELKQKDENLNKFKFLLEQKQKEFEVQKTKEELSKLPNLVGLQNIGATCYMNATLQALSNTNSLTEYFLDKTKFSPNNQNKKLTSEYYKVLSNLWSETKKNGDYAPHDFKQALSEENQLFAGIQANDSKDLINFLLERFHIELNNPKPNNNDNNIVNVNQMDEMQTLSAFISDYFNSNRSIITDSFYGILETKSKCGGCQNTKFNFQIFSFLEFPLEQVNIYMYQMGRRFNMINQAPKNPDVDLYECFEYYQKIDVMNGQNQMYCNICNGNRDTFYGTTIYSLPNYLIINLNRGKGAVYECRVNFPEKLNLLNYASFKQGNTYFHLYAVICHLGPSSMSGHFVAYCKHRKNNKWYKYNDSFVTECTKDKEYNEGMPYILFYKAV